MAVKVVIKRNPHKTEPKVKAQVKVNGKTLQLKIGTWNVRKMSEAGKIDNIIQKMERRQINVLGIAKTRWPGAGKIIKANGHTFLYSGGEAHPHGVVILLDRKIAASMKCFVPLSERSIMVKLKGEPFNLNIIQVYLPTTSHEDEEVSPIYDTIENIIKQSKTMR